MIALDILGPNFTRVTVGRLSVWFSYRTPIAFRVDDDEIIATENQWSQTTGRHLNAVQPDKSRRVGPVAFTSRLNALTKHLAEEIPS